MDRILPSFHGWSLKITIEVPLRYLFFLCIVAGYFLQHNQSETLDFLNLIPYSSDSELIDEKFQGQRLNNKTEYYHMTNTKILERKKVFSL